MDDKLTLTKIFSICKGLATSTIVITAILGGLAFFLPMSMVLKCILFGLFLFSLVGVHVLMSFFYASSIIYSDIFDTLEDMDFEDVLRQTEAFTEDEIDNLINSINLLQNAKTKLEKELE